MKTIFKYPIRIDDAQTVTMRKGAKILSVQVQAGIICILALVDAEARLNEHRRILIYGTGHDIPETAIVYLGTVQTPPLVWHVFEASNAPGEL